MRSGPCDLPSDQTRITPSDLYDQVCAHTPADAEAVVIGGNSLLGGRFSIAASVIGALIITTISIGIRLIGFPSEYNLIIKAGLVLVILILQSPRISAEWRLWRDSHRAQREAQLQRPT